MNPTKPHEEGYTKMDETINALLSQKPETPHPQGEMWLTWQEIPGKTGKLYIKAKRNDQEHGGKLVEIVNAEQTINKNTGEPFIDSFGNISFNIEFTPIYGERAEQPAANKLVEQVRSEYRKAHDTMHEQDQHSEKTSIGVDEVRRHIMKSANLYILCVNAVEHCIVPQFPAAGKNTETFQNAVSSLFIEATKKEKPGERWTSLLDLMPDHPMKGNNK